MLHTLRFRFLTDETHRVHDRGDARVLSHDHDARVDVAAPVYNEPRTASRGPIDRVDGGRRRTTTRRVRARRSRDACRTRDDRSIDRSRATPRRDATRRDANRARGN